MAKPKTRDELIALGNRYLKERAYVEAGEAFREAGYADGVMTAANTCLKLRHLPVARYLFEEAMKLFQTAGDVDGLMTIGNTCAANGYIEVACTAYRAACHIFQAR